MSDTDLSLKQKLDLLVQKRDHAADVLNKPALALSYQAEIDSLLEPPAAPPVVNTFIRISDVLRILAELENRFDSATLAQGNIDALAVDALQALADTAPVVPVAEVEAMAKWLEERAIGTIRPLRRTSGHGIDAAAMLRKLAGL